jgi:hypothetical protein
MIREFVARSEFPDWRRSAISADSRTNPRKPTSVHHGARGAVDHCGSTVNSAVSEFKNASAGLEKNLSDTSVARTTNRIELWTRRTSLGSVGISWPVVTKDMTTRVTSDPMRSPPRTMGCRCELSTRAIKDAFRCV